MAQAKHMAELVSHGVYSWRRRKIYCIGAQKIRMNIDGAGGCVRVPNAAFGISVRRSRV